MKPFVSTMFVHEEPAVVPFCKREWSERPVWILLTKVDHGGRKRVDKLTAQHASQLNVNGSGLQQTGDPVLHGDWNEGLTNAWQERGWPQFQEKRCEQSRVNERAAVEHDLGPFFCADRVDEGWHVAQAPKMSRTVNAVGRD